LYIEVEGCKKLFKLFLSHIWNFGRVIVERLRKELLFLRANLVFLHWRSIWKIFIY